MTTAVARILDDLRERGGLQGKDIANIVGTSPPTVSRWARGNGVPSLHARHPLLKGERAIDLINQGRTEEVLAVIERLDSGAYV
jgi:transcriptional regulator with XRE-family HTH domain